MLVVLLLVDVVCSSGGGGGRCEATPAVGRVLGSCLRGGSGGTVAMSGGAYRGLALVEERRALRYMHFAYDPLTA